MNKTSVMIVEDQSMPRQLFEQFVNTSENYKLALSLSNASFAIMYLQTYHVDLILMDVITSHGSNGLLAAEDIKKHFPDIKIIIVTSMPECSYLERAKEIGIEGFWYKETSKEPILNVMDRVMNGEHVYPKTSPLIKLGLSNNREFTRRELEILRLMTGGYSNKEIAEKLNISANVVRNHIVEMMEKTGFRSRTQLAVRAREAGIVILDRNIEEI